VVLALLVGVDGHERPLAEPLGVHDLGVDVGEDLEHAPDPQVVAVAAHPEADLPRPLDVFLERLDADLLADLGVTKNGHGKRR
jgi:hypothetical protein